MLAQQYIYSYVTKIWDGRDTAVGRSRSSKESALVWINRCFSLPFVVNIESLREYQIWPAGWFCYKQVRSTVSWELSSKLPVSSAFSLFPCWNILSKVDNPNIDLVLELYRTKHATLYCTLDDILHCTPILFHCFFFHFSFWKKARCNTWFMEFDGLVHSDIYILHGYLFFSLKKEQYNFICMHASTGSNN
jgi:hypothetical protein